MNIKPLFKKVVLGAAEASLDIAGAALLPGAWPILKIALEPVMERLKERLGGEDITASPEKAQAAVQEFENDSHLQEMLRSKLLESLDSLVKGQQEINEDIQKLMLIVSGDQKLLKELVDTVARLEEKIEDGVDLKDETVNKLLKAIARQAEDTRQVRAIALSEMGPVAELVGRQVGRLQARAVELIEEKQLDRANDELHEGLMLVSALVNEAPTDLHLRMQLGMIYKTFAQVWQAAGRMDQVDAYLKRAESVFRFVRDITPDDEKHTFEAANAIHGLGNMLQLRGDIAAAIDNYKQATVLNPKHCYAWHDLFLCYYEQAKKGEVDVAAMQLTLDKVKETGAGQPGLGAAHIAKLDEILYYVKNNLAT